MLVDQIVRDRRAAGSPSGGVGVREFASLEFPREDVHWVASQTRRSSPKTGGRRGVWARFWRPFETPRESEQDPEAIVEPVANP